MRLALLSALLLLPGCFGDETVAGYGGADKVWTLAELDGAPYPARATLRFPKRGRIAGDAPCNSYGGDMTAPYPWFDAERVIATKRACPDLSAEAAFFTALEAVSIAEVLGDTLILTGEGGREMVFKSGE